MPAAEAATPVSDTEAEVLLADLADTPALVLAVSGGPDSTALLWLAARWRARLKHGPRLVAVTVDHGLRPEAAREARAVKRFAADLGVAHRTLRWRGDKPTTGLQEAARTARYRLLGRAAAAAGATHILTAHTRDDQAETVLFRLARGSGLTGLAGMARVTPLDGRSLVRPFVDLPKARLVATLERAGIAAADDPSNRDPRFARVRWRALATALAAEGLDATRIAQFAGRMRRADAAIEAAVGDAVTDTALAPWSDGGPILLSAERIGRLPGEVALRLIGRAVGRIATGGAVPLGKLEELHAALSAAMAAGARFRRTLSGAMVTVAGGRVVVERAPPRRTGPAAAAGGAGGRHPAGKVPFTKGR